MQANISHASRVSLLRPCPSAPNINAVGPEIWILSSFCEASLSRPIHQIFDFFRVDRARAILVTLTIGQCSSPPDADLANAPVICGVCRF